MCLSVMPDLSTKFGIFISIIYKWAFSEKKNIIFFTNLYAKKKFILKKLIYFFNVLTWLKAIGPKLTVRS